MTDPATAPAHEKTLALRLDLDVARARSEVAVPEPVVSDEVRQRADAIAERLVSIDPADPEARESTVNAVERMGRELQRRSATRSRLLQAPLRDLTREAEDGGPVARSLADLRIEVEKLDPSSLELEPGWFNRMLGLIPGVGTPLQRYFMRFESSQGVIDAIIRSLESGRDQLRRDNITLNDDQQGMRELTLTLTDQLTLARALDDAISAKLERELAADDPRRVFIEEEVVFVLRQRIMDLQQQLAVNQQGVLATALIVRNNRELIRGVDRALDVTISALQVAVSVAMAVAHQRMVLDKVEALNRTTSDVIAGTAQRLRAQGSRIHDQASGAMLDMEALKSAFRDIDVALEEISRYRREALPEMASMIVEMDELTTAAEQAIERHERTFTTGSELDLLVSEPPDRDT